MEDLFHTLSFGARFSNKEKKKFNGMLEKEKKIEFSKSDNSIPKELVRILEKKKKRGCLITDLFLFLFFVIVEKGFFWKIFRKY